MNPLSIKARNYRTFASLDLDLPAGCAAIIGANGAGKSSLVNIIDLALFGPDGRSWAPYLTQGVESTELELELVFEHAGELYRSRRGYSSRGSGKTTLDLERNHLRDGADERGEREDSWLPETRETQAATQEHLEEILGLTRETFRASAMLVQGDGAAFTEAKPADRKRVLAAVLGLDRFDRYAELVKRDRKQAEVEAERLQGALDRADAELAGKADVEARLTAAAGIVTEATATLSAAEADLQGAAAAFQAAQEIRTRKAEALAAVTAAEAALQPLERAHEDAATATQEVTVAEDELATLTTDDQRADLERSLAGLESKIEAHRAAVRAREETLRLRELRTAEKAAIEAQADERERKTLELDAKASHVSLGEVAKCPVCEQELDADARKATASSLRAQAQEAADQAAAIRERAAVVQIPEITDEPTRPDAEERELADVRGQIEKARAAELQRERLAERIRGLRLKVDARPADEQIVKARQSVQEARTAAETVGPVLTDAELTVVQRDALTARSRIDTDRARLDAAKADEARAAGELERLNRIAADTETDRAERARLLATVDRLAIIEKACGRDGIPALIIGSAAIPSIETEAQRILQELGGSTASARIELRTGKALASGGIADALDVVVITDRGERPYETFSGGERTRLNLALRIALARLLATRRGAESRILAIDEPEYLDDAGTAALASVLRGLNGDFERVYLVSHVPDLRAAFDVSLEVVRGDDGLSRIAA